MSGRHTYSSVLSHRTGNGWAIFSVPVKHDNKSGQGVTLTHHDVGLCEEWQQASRGTRAICCCVSSLSQGYVDHSASGKSALIRVVMHGWNLADDFRLCSHGEDDELQAVKRTPFTSKACYWCVCARMCSYTHVPPSLLWPCGWLALLAFTATLKPSALCFCICACVVVCVLSSADRTSHSWGQPAGR